MRMIAAQTAALPDDTILFHRLVWHESLGRLFEGDLEVLSESSDLELDAVLGQPVVVRMESVGEGTRHFHALCTRFSAGTRHGRYSRYSLKLRPWLWLLTRTSDCRIFQGVTALEIIQEVFREHGFTDVDDRTSGTYEPRNYCVQYRETDFNFVSRLMEQEGIYYYFEHDDSRHVLVLADSYGSHDVIEGCDALRFDPARQDDIEEGDHFFEWDVYRQVQPGVFALTDFDFESPRSSLVTNSVGSREHAFGDFEIFDFPGDYVTTESGERIARVRMEEYLSNHEEVRATGNVRALHTGGLFQLTDHQREDQNREYLVTSAVHELETDEYESDTGSADGPRYRAAVTAMDARVPYRPDRVTPKPVVQGPQTAVVVGKSGEEIWTDKFGRVKVQFHWDRYGESDENSSCWIRVAQLWAGKGFGAMYIPRIGQEVIVEFLEGDPDRPIVTGRVYNGDNLPPYELPGEMTRSVIRSRSTKEGGADHYNEISFEDDKGNELLYLHAEKNQEIVVENDESHSVGNDRSHSVGNDESTSIGNNRTEEVAEDETITIGGSRTETVEGDENVTISGTHTHTVAGDQQLAAEKNQDATVGQSATLSVGENREISVGENQALDIGSELVIQAGTKITIKTGDASITMKENGDITIKGKDITLKGSGKINLKADSDVVIKGSKVKEN